MHGLNMCTCRWILSHISAYSVRRRVYVLWLNSVMLVAGGLATIPCISWGHKVYWMVISCVPFPELCYHIWRMLTDAIESSEPLSDRFSLSGLYFVRVFGQFSYQLFPAIYFAAYDGCLPLYVSEPLWSICDWCLKMCMTSSLMEAEFFTAAQVRSSLTLSCPLMSKRWEQDNSRATAVISWLKPRCPCGCLSEARRRLDYPFHVHDGQEFTGIAPAVHTALSPLCQIDRLMTVASPCRSSNTTCTSWSSRALTRR